MEYHVSIKGDDANDGTAAQPLRTISAAAEKAQPGDIITVHAGVYREWIKPPRGGESDAKRIVYQAAAGEHVEIKGSEVVTGWKQLDGDVWTVTLPNTFFGDYNPFADPIHGDWFNPKDRPHHTGAVYLDGEWLLEAATRDEVLDPAGSAPQWFAEVDASNTTIWARFPGADPNQALVEVNVRRAVFYPEQPGVNHLTVRGFTMRHAATQWAPPTAEQIGLIGTHWSKGWIIEDCVISHSRCVGVALGKYGDEFDNTSADTAEGYVLTIERALTNGWSGENIGHHVVRNNTISHCEQAGVVGSLGAIFSTITGNTIHDIHVQRLFTGAEMAGIKIHAAIDTEISDNRIYRTIRGIWLDWMNQGSRVTRNVLYENIGEDLFVEVNHGPFLVDHNLMLSDTALLNMSEGGAYAHNLIAGRIVLRPESSRETPYHPAHSTEVAGLINIQGGDDRFYNNLFVSRDGLAGYDEVATPTFMAGNVFLMGAAPSKREVAPIVLPDFDPKLDLKSAGPSLNLHFIFDNAWGTANVRPLVTSELLGRAKIPGVPYELPDGAPIRLDTDYFGNPRDAENPYPGPFELPGGGEEALTIWPR
ncbi:MAG: hypothetical protein AMXMBFR82_46200 [Candidatus Hydrogenedentota bacterium]